MANNIGGSSGIQASIQQRLQEIRAGFLNHLPRRIDEIAHAAATFRNHRAPFRFPE
ncbi:hypothetical protein VPG91_20245 [Nitrospirillum amazonense]|uniref:hypothetical protein n=1 Tax=Nitrospirillum amazonense TaxID=28077 RepID=UPI002DD43257|nr:hypothetical protein [Nitrospirillum amazonense]MEC4593346.1 hypothetical protein [Nitrospirillum amazonense]